MKVESKSLLSMRLFVWLLVGATLSAVVSGLLGISMSAVPFVFGFGTALIGWWDRIDK